MSSLITPSSGEGCNPTVRIFHGYIFESEEMVRNSTKSLITPDDVIRHSRMRETVLTSYSVTGVSVVKARQWHISISHAIIQPVSFKHPSVTCVLLCTSQKVKVQRFALGYSKSDRNYY